jgi:hypothetical protein
MTTVSFTPKNPTRRKISKLTKKSKTKPFEEKKSLFKQKEVQITPEDLFLLAKRKNSDYGLII